MNGEQLGEGLLYYLEGTIYKPTLCFLQNFKLVICCKEDVALGVYLDILLKKTIWDDRSPWLTVI